MKGERVDCCVTFYYRSTDTIVHEMPSENSASLTGHQ